MEAVQFERGVGIWLYDVILSELKLIRQREKLKVVALINGMQFNNLTVTAFLLN